MNPQVLTLKRRGSAALTFVCAIAIGPADTLAYAWYRAPAAARSQTYPSHQPQQQPQAAEAVIPADQLDSLVAPIALYPDPLLAQTLAASTYPLEIMQMQQWLTTHPGLQGKALADAVARQPWDPSVQALAALPDVVKRLSDNIQWTTDLGNAFLAQEPDVMNAVQRMRQRAEGTGALKSTAQQVVETQVTENQEVIVIEQADPQVVYVPSYNPVAVYGEPVYPYPPIYYPPANYWAGPAIGFGLGVAMGAFWGGGGGWGWNVGWGRNDININRSANFVRNSNFYRNGNFNTWRHNAVHRGGVGYANRSTAARFGGTYRGQALTNRAAVARQQLGRQGGNLASARAGALRSGAVGTSGSFNRGDFNRGNFNRGNFNRGDFGSRNFNRGNFNRGNFNRGDFGSRNFNRGNFNRGSFNRGDFNRGNFSSKHFNRGNFGGSRSFNRGSFGGGRSFGGGGRSFGGGGRSFGGGGGGRRGGGRR